RLFGPGGLFGEPLPYDGGPDVIRPLPEGPLPVPRGVSPRPAAPGAVEPELQLPAELPKPSSSIGAKPLPEYASPAGTSSGEALPPKIGAFQVPDNLTYGTTLFGDHAHGEIAELLQKLYPDAKFIFRVRPGQTGMDVEVHEDSVSEVGHKFLEIK